MVWLSLGWLLTCLGCNCSPTATEEASVVQPPNVLFVMWDTVRADRMSLYGHTRQTTPKLDAFADDAMVFERAYAPGMWTLPTHASMFTGLPPRAHGAGANYRWLDEGHDTLAEHFHGAGFATYAFSSNIVAGPLMNVMQGFQEQHYTYRGPYTRPARAAVKAKLIADDASTEMSPMWDRGSPRDQDLWDKAVFKDAAPLMTKAFLRWMDERPDDRPFFAYLNFMEAHTPRIPSAWAREQILDDMTRELGKKTDQSLFTEVAWMVGKHEYTDDELEAIRGVYDATLLDLDDATHALFEGLDARGMLDNTVVVLVSDHGESLGEHRLLEHRYSVQDGLLHVPLMIRYPEAVKPGRRPEPVSTIDLYATLLDLTGVKGSDDDNIRSTSLFAAERPVHVASTLRDPYASTLCSVVRVHPDVDYQPWLYTYDAWIEGDLKIVQRSDGQRTLYDLSKDPGEEHDLAPTRVEDADRLTRALNAYVDATPVYTPADGGAPPAAKDDVAGLLEALGYADGEAVDPSKSLVDQCTAKTDATPRKVPRGRRGRRAR